MFWSSKNWICFRIVVVATCNIGGCRRPLELWLFQVQDFFFDFKYLYMTKSDLGLTWNWYFVGILIMACANGFRTPVQTPAFFHLRTITMVRRPNSSMKWMVLARKSVREACFDLIIKWPKVKRGNKIKNNGQVHFLCTKLEVVTLIFEHFLCWTYLYVDRLGPGSWLQN